jgi:hypothetical protein
MKKVFLIFIFLTFIGCQTDLTGHWHTERFDGSFLSFDIKKNNDAYIIFSLNDDPIKGEHKPKEKQLLFSGDCGVFMFEYQLKKEKLYLTNALGTKTIAEKADHHYDRFQDFHSILDIDFLIINKKRNELIPKDSLKYNHIKEFININYSEKDKSIQFEFLDKYQMLKILI